jgi:putative hydrolase of the HAD superfamily
MTERTLITALFLDIGGVLLTNGWDRNMRKDAAATFGLDYEEMNERHHLTFDTYEEGKLSLDEYLRRVVFYEKRPFSLEEFRAFMFAQSQPYPDMIALVQDLKSRHRLKVAAVSNEGRELTIHRIRKFELGTFTSANQIRTSIVLPWTSPKCRRIRSSTLKTGQCSWRWQRASAFEASSM